MTGHGPPDPRETVAASSGYALCATSPRHLAGPGDPDLIIHPLHAAGWINHSRPGTAHLLYDSPGGDLTVALRPVPSAYAPWWHFTGTHDSQPWSAEFGGNTPCEILAEFTAALLHPSPDTSAEVWPLLTAARLAVLRLRPGRRNRLAPLRVPRPVAAPPRYHACGLLDRRGGRSPRHLLLERRAARCAPAPRHRVRHRPDPLGTRSEDQGRGP